jgi:uncharacterized damage-inducible protein DinB
MAIGADGLRMQIDYTQWASSRLIEAASTLSPEELTRDFKTADRSILETLVHVYAAERLWLRRLLDEPAKDFVTDADYRLSVVQNDWPELHDRWKHWGRALTDASAQASIAYTDLEGNRWELRVWQIVMHAVNHATHHRGQVSGFLRTLGRTPPPVDLIYFYRR